jgi:D-alanyl-D-alanine carboxypeptidase
MQSIYRYWSQAARYAAIGAVAMVSMGGVAYAAATPPSAAIAACMARAAANLGFNGAVEARIGEATVTRFFGTADAAGDRPVAGETRFNMGSASKMFTAVAIGRLVDRGAVDFDAPIERYLPGLTAPFRAITIAQLLNHTSGLGDYFQPGNASRIAAASTAHDLLPLALAEPPAFAPGSKRAYSNSGFVVLGAVIEQVSGLTYQDFLQREILAPLGMRDTRAEAGGAAEPMSRMSPDGMRRDPEPVRMPPLSASPAGGMFSTPTDIAAFLTALAENRLLSRRTLATLLSPRADPGGGTGTYGYGFNVRATPLRVGHGGGAPGVNAEIALYPDSGWQLIALANRDPPVASQMVTVLEKALFATDPESACASALADPELKAIAPPQRSH